MSKIGSLGTTPPLNLLMQDAAIPALKKAPGQDLERSGNLRNAAEIKKVAEEFESLFLNLVLKSMRDSVHKSGLIDGGNAESIYTGMLDAEYTKLMAAQRSTGIADNIEEFLLRSVSGQDEKAAVEFARKAQEVQGLKAYAGQGLRAEGKSATIERDPSVLPTFPVPDSPAKSAQSSIETILTRMQE